MSIPAGISPPCSPQPRIPVRIGDLEVFAPADILQYELNRAPGESDEQFADAKDMYGRLFGAAMR